MATKPSVVDLLRDELVAVRCALRKAITAADLQQPNDDYSTVDLAAVVLTRAISELHQMVDDRDAELRALRDEVRDWRDTATSAAGEGCGDEVHCTCVGPLRKTVADLRAENERLRAEPFADPAERLIHLVADRAESIASMAGDNEPAVGELAWVVSLLRAEQARGGA